MLLQFLGTNAGIPSIKRNVTGISLIMNNNINDVWLFDCGEATQHQILRTSIKLNNIKKIFITHLHGDHIFGLPGLLASRSACYSNTPIEIYGSKGLKKYIEMSLKLSNSYINFSIDIFEIDEGEIFNDGRIKVLSFLLNHSIECYGYRIDEINNKVILDINKLIIDKIYPGPIYKYLKMGEKIYLNDKIINGKNYLNYSINKKSIVILGDTAPVDNIDIYVKNVDVLVHEATLSNDLLLKANLRGHSTNIQAANFAKRCLVKKLIITHFSSRYTNKEIKEILTQCVKLFLNTKIAYDFSTFKI